MSFALTVAGVAVAGGSIASSMISSNAAQSAASDQEAAANNGIAVQQQEFNQVQKLLSPYVNTGNSSETAQANLLGLNGNTAQQNAITGIENSSQYKALNQQGQNAILQNAAATGGLRGGNVQTALAQYSPNLLNSLIQQQYGNLSGLTGLGESAAAQTGNAGQNMANQVSNLYGQAGAAAAGGALGSANAMNSGISGLTSALGLSLGNGTTTGLSGLLSSYGNLSSAFSSGFL